MSEPPHGFADNFILAPDVARKLVVACDEYRSELIGAVGEARSLSWIGGFGTLCSAQALRKKFEEKAVGGPDALVDVLASHIAVVDDMRAQFQACIDNAADQESANVAALRAHDLPN